MRVASPYLFRMRKVDKPHIRVISMRKSTVVILAVIIALFFIVPVQSKINENAGTTGFSFLKLGVGAKAVAMGGAFVAVADDPSTVYYNPAGTMNLEGRQVMAGYHNYVLDVQSGFVAGVVPFLGTRKAAFFVDYLNLGDFVETDIHGVPTGNFSGGDIMIGVNFSSNFHKDWSAGVNLKFINESAAGYSAQAAAADLGVLYRFRDLRTTAGACVYNLGGALSAFTPEGSKEKLPMGLRVGVAHSLRELPLIVALDGVLPNDNDPYLNAGVELYRFKPLYLRAGYSTFGENYKTGSDSDAFGGFSFGFGLDYKKYHIAYAFVPYLDLGSSHRVTLIGKF